MKRDEKHMGLIKKIAAKLIRAFPGLEWEDAEQAGRMGVWMSEKTYDPAKGKFSTWAWKRVLFEVQQAGRHARPVHVPSNVEREVSFGYDSLDAEREDGKTLHDAIACDATDAETALEVPFMRERLARELPSAPLSPVERWLVEGRLEGKSMADLGRERGWSEQYTSRFLVGAVDVLQRAVAA